MDTKIALVTGASGFLGRALVGRLVGAGVAVRALDVRPGNLSDPLVEHWAGTFLDASLMKEALVGADCVYHLAATNFPRESNLDPVRDAEENLIGSLQLIQMAHLAGVRRFVFASSGGTVYGPTDRNPIDEDHPQNPISAYGIAKLAVEKYLRLYAANRNLQTLSLRIANPYGPGQDIRKAQGALTTFVHRALSDEPIEIWGDGSVERDFIHVDDVARALLAARQAEASGTEINIGSGEGTSLNALVDAIAAALGRRPQVTYKAARNFDVQANYLAVGRARALLGWAPQITLRDGIAALIADLSVR